MSESRRRRKSSKRAKKEEQEIIDSINKEEEQAQEEEQQEQEEEQPQYTPEQLRQFMEDSDINQSMMDMDIRIKYGFIKTLYNNLLSINARFNWRPEELVAIGMIFRDFNSIETNVYKTVVQNNAQSTIQEEEEEEEEDVDESSNDIN